MSKGAKLAVVAFFFALVGWLYIHTGRLPGSAHRLEGRLAARVERALHATGHDEWARVEAHGRIMALFGVAPNEAARMEAIGAVKSAACCGGIARVADNTDLLKVVDPYEFEARYEDGALTLSGYAPDRDARDEIAARAARVFGLDEVRAGEIEIASGEPPGANWIHAIEFGLSQLKRLDHGVFRIEGEAMTLFGAAPNAGVRAEAARQLLQAPAPFSGRAEITYAAPADAAVTDESAGDDGAPVPAPPEHPAPSPARGDCQAEFDRHLESGSVEFGFNAAELSPASAALLDAIAETALRCGRYNLKIDGHTDASGDPLFNVDLSQRRAQAVVDFLVSRGVDQSRLTAEGFGASAPIATNNTIEGHRRNRRIEITVTE